MAIGDTLNQNPFGTNYNAEEEERKKAELAAQGAMMGAGDQSFRGATGIQDIAGMQGVPQGGTLDPTQGARDLLIGRQFNRGGPVRISDMGSLIQEPGTSAFSMEAAGQVNPMMELQSLEAPAMTNDVANVGMQLREPKQTNGGVLGLGSVDVESPLAITGTPDFSNLNLNGVNLQIPPELQFKTPGTGEMGLTNLFQEGSLPRMVTEAAGATGDFAMDKTKDLSEFLTGQNFFTRDKTAREVEGSLAFLQSPEVQASMKAAQAPSGASALGTTPSVTPTIETPSEGAQEQGAGQTSTAPTNGLTTVGGASLSEFLSGQAMPERGFTQEESPLGGRGVTLTPDQMNKLSAQREARLDARPDFGKAVSDRDRRAARGDGISMADQTDMAKANARGATPREVARGNQVANALGVDLKTGQSLQATGGLTFDQQLAQNKFEFDVNKFNFEQAREASDEATANAQSATAAKFAVRDQLRQGANVMDKAQRAGKNIGFFTTGATGALFGLVAGTGAYDQKATVETLEADAAFSALQRMRDASKTGGALGNVSERELDLLKATAGSLRVGQSEEQFRENLGQYVERYNEAMLNVYDAFVADYGEEGANEAFKVNGRQDLIPQQGDNQSTGGGTTVQTSSGQYSIKRL